MAALHHQYGILAEGDGAGFRQPRYEKRRFGIIARAHADAGARVEAIAIRAQAFAQRTIVAGAAGRGSMLRVLRRD